MGIEGTVGALVGATHLADAENVERRGVESCDKESFWSQRFYNDCLAGSRQVCHWEIPRRKFIFRIHNGTSIQYFIRFALREKNLVI